MEGKIEKLNAKIIDFIKINIYILVYKEFFFYLNLYINELLINFA